MSVYQPKTSAGTADLNSKMARIFYDAPVLTTKGKILLLSLIALLFLASFPAFKEYYTNLRAPAFVEIFKAFLLYSPTLVALRYFDRRNRAPWFLVLFALFSTTFFFGPVAAQNLSVFGNGGDTFWAAGFIEEFWKVAPLMLLVLFAPRAVGGTRDGLIYGALSGTGFAILEFAVKSGVFANFTTAGWIVLTGGAGGAPLLGASNQIVWAASVGAALGWAVQSRNKIKRFLVPVSVYLGIAALHIFNDYGGSALTTVIACRLFETVVPARLASEGFLTQTFDPFPVFAATVNLLLVNVVLLPILFRVLCRSGDAERRIIREQLDGEIGGAITREEFEGVVADRRCRTRRIKNMPAKAANKIVQLQNEMAFHKAFAANRLADADADPAVRALRKRIEIERCQTH